MMRDVTGNKSSDFPGHRLVAWFLYFLFHVFLVVFGGLDSMV